MTFDSIITIAAFCCYLIFMLCIGTVSYTHLTLPTKLEV